MTRVIITWETVIEQKEPEVREKEFQLRQKDSLIEQERREKERLAALLKKVGIKDEG